MNSHKFLLACALLLFGCVQSGGGGGGGGGGTLGGESTANPLVAHWLSDCLDLGSGNVNRIYLEINETLQVSVAYLTYTGADCTGTYTLTNQDSIVVTEAEYEQNFSIEDVEDVPENFEIVKITDIDTFMSEYAVIYFNDHEFFELAGFAGTHDTWTEWQGEADVFAFSENPSTYEPLTYTKYHFTKSELP